MKRHLTEKELIEYQFGLADQKRSNEIADHLKDCADCRQLAEQLKRKFASLDLLRQETAVSEELIRQTLEQAQKSGKSSIFLFKKPLWMAAAAVLLFGSMLLMSEFWKDEKPGRQFAKDIKRSAENKFVEPLNKMTVADSAAKPKFEMGSSGIATEKIVNAKIPDKPPFAPASAIELVTLPRRDNVQITIYNSADLTLVREKRNLTLKKGWNWLQFMWANTLIDPTSLSLEPQQQADKIDVQQLVFPAGLKDIGRWLIRSEVEGQVPFEVTYFTSGLSWRAFYMGTLTADENKMTLQGYVRVANRSGEDYENAQTRLIVGNIHQLDQIAELSGRQYPYDRPGVKFDDGNIRFMNGKVGGSGPLLGDKPTMLYADIIDDSAPKEVKKEGLSEYFLYTIEGTETIPNQWDKRLLSFDVNDIEVKSLYKYDEQRWGKQTIRFLSFANDKKHNLGDTPIPNGNVRIYSQTGQDSHLSYVGGTDVKYIPVDEDVELNLGSARLVSVEPVPADLKTANFVFDKKGNIAGWDEIQSWKIEITNTRRLPVEIEITRGFGTGYWTLKHDDKSVLYEKYDAQSARFKTTLQPQSKQTFTYTLTTYHGLREQALIEIKKQN